MKNRAARVRRRQLLPTQGARLRPADPADAVQRGDAPAAGKGTPAAGDRSRRVGSQSGSPSSPAYAGRHPQRGQL